MQWLEKDFLGYLTEWENSIASRKDLTHSEQKMCLSTETLQGLRITGKQKVHKHYPAVTVCIYILSTAVISFVEAGRYLLQYPGFKFLLSERFTQDPLEAFFSGRGREGEAVTIQLHCSLHITLHHCKSRDQLHLLPAVMSGVANMTEKRLWMIHLLP